MIVAQNKKFLKFKKVIMSNHISRISLRYINLLNDELNSKLGLSNNKYKISDKKMKENVSHNYSF